MEIVISKLPLFTDCCFECVKQLLFDYTRCEICGCVSMLKKVGDKQVCYRCKDYWLELYDDEEFEDTVVIKGVGFRAFNDSLKEYKKYLEIGTVIISFMRFVYFETNNDKVKTFIVRTLADKVGKERGMFDVIFRFNIKNDINNIMEDYVNYYIDLN